MCDMCQKMAGRPAEPDFEEVKTLLRSAERERDQWHEQTHKLSERIAVLEERLAAYEGGFEG